MNSRRVGSTVALGALCGLAWAASFRAVMSEFVGSGSTVVWLDTFGAILLPGVIVGGLLGWAHTIRLSGGRRGWRWLGATPAVFAIAPMLATSIIGGPRLAMTEPRGVWVALLASSLLTLFAIAASIPFRPVIEAQTGGTHRVVTMALRHG